MKLSVFAVGLLFMFLGITLSFSSNVAYQESSSTWDMVKTEVDSQLISSDFTEGDRVRLVVSPTSEWRYFLEPGYFKYVWVNITDPHGNRIWYEITYTTAGGSSLSLYNVTIMSSDGFGSQGEEAKKEAAIIWKARYTGEYMTEVWGILPPGGGPPSSLTLLKENVTVSVEYPYARYFYPAIGIFLIGIVLSVFGAKTSKLKASVKRRTRVKRFSAHCQLIPNMHPLA